MARKKSSQKFEVITVGEDFASRADGSLDDIVAVLSTNIHTGSVHPSQLIYFDFTAVVCPEKNSAAFMLELKGKLYQLPPVGEFGVKLAFSQIPPGKSGIIFGLNEKQRLELEEEFSRAYGCEASTLLKVHTEYLNQAFILDDFDPSLSGSRYGWLRRSVGRAERDGLRFRKAEPSDKAQIISLYDSWENSLAERGKKINHSNYVYCVLRVYSEIPDYEGYVVSDSSNELLAAAFLGVTGVSAQGEIKMIGKNQSQASEFLDYMIFRELKQRGVKYYDHGSVDLVELEQNKGLINYKRHFFPVESRHFDVSYVSPVM